MKVVGGARFVELGGETFRLHFTVAGIGQAESDLGFSILPLNGTEFWKGLGSVSYTLRLLYAATRKTAPRLGFERLTELLEESDFPAVADAVDRAFVDFFPKLLPLEARQRVEEARQMVLEQVEAAASIAHGKSSTTTSECTSECNEGSLAGVLSEKSSG